MLKEEEAKVQSSVPMNVPICPENQVVTTTVTTILVRETEGANVTTTMATRGASSPSSMWKRTSPRSSAETSNRTPHLLSTSRPAAIRIEMVEPVGPSAYSLSLQAQRSPLEQWKLLKNKLIRKKSTDDSPAAAVLDPAERFRQTVRAAAQEEGIICRTNELKRLLQKGERSTVDHTTSTSSCNKSESQSPPSLEVTEVTNPSSSLSSTLKDCQSGESSRKNSSKSLSPSLSPSTASNNEINPTTVKWDETNTLDAALFGDAIEAFLKGLSGSGPTSSPVRSVEKRVSFRIRTIQDETDHIELLTDDEIRDLERQDKKDHDLIVNHAFRPDFGRGRINEYEGRNSKLGGDTKREHYGWSNRNADGRLKDVHNQSPSGSMKLRIKPGNEKSSCLAGDIGAEESKEIKFVISASGIPDFASKLVRRQKRNIDTSRNNGYDMDPQQRYEQSYQPPPQQQLQKYQQLHPATSQQGSQDTYKFDRNLNVNPPASVHYVSGTDENDPNDEREVVLNSPKQMSPQSLGQERRSNSEDEEARSPKYEFNYDIPKDSFQSDVINGQFSTFAKLPMSFESLIQSDASFLDSLSEQPPENVDRSVFRNNNNNNNDVPNPHSQEISTAQMRNPRNEQVSNLRGNTDEPEYDTEVFEPAQRQPQTSQMQIPQANQFKYSPQNQQYYPTQPIHQPPQKMIQLPPSPPPIRHVELPVYVNGGNEQSDGYEYLNLRQNPETRHNNFPHNNHKAPLRKAPALKGLIRQASQAFRQPYQGFMERSSNDNYPTTILQNNQRSRLLIRPQHRRRADNQDHYRNFASEQRVKDMRMMYYTTTPPPPPPPQKVVNAQLQVIKNGLPTLPVLPKQLSINYISGPPPPPPPPPKDPYGMMSYTTPPPPPPPPPPQYDRRRPSTYNQIMDQMWDKYTTTPPPPPPSKVIQFGLNFSQSMDEPMFVKAPKEYTTIRNFKRRKERSVAKSQYEENREAERQTDSRIEEDDVCEKFISNSFSSNFCPFDSTYPRDLILQAWDRKKIDELLEKKNESIQGMVNRGTTFESSGHTNSSHSVNECTSFERKIYPQKAKNTNGLWKVVVNLEDKFQQDITALSCKSRKAVSKRFGRFSDFIGSDENWAQLADESAPPFFSPLSGLNFPIFSPLMGEGPSGSRHRGHHHSQPPPYASLDYDRPTSASEGRSRSPPAGYYDGPPPQKGGRNPMMTAPPPPPPPPPPPITGGRGNPGYNDRRSRPEKSNNGPYLGPSGRGRGRGRGKNNDYGPEPYYPEYDDGVPHYSYNPAETPRCAKEVNVSYCIEDPEYPIETMQYEIDRDSSMLEQIMPEADEKMELVEGIPRKEDEKYNFRHYFTYRIDELDNVTEARSSGRHHKEEVVFGLKPDYYKDGGYICPSLVTYVQPRRARNTEGLWKVILNLRERYKGQDYKQNVRLEQCLHAGRECSFTSSFYNSQCIQKYNNHRLLAWTEEKGIHLDVFRLPVACSCHFKGKTMAN